MTPFKFSGLTASERLLFVANILGIASGTLLALGNLLRLSDRHEIPTDATMFGAQPKEPPRNNSYFEL